jgi:hypothetical protein
VRVMTPKHVVVDGSNIATEGRNLPSLAQLDEAVRAFLEERPHEDFIVVVDATFEHRIDPSEKPLYDEALAAGELITPPAGTIGRGDKFLLEIAERADATVFSNDSFQEFHGEYGWLFDEGRLIGGKPVPGIGWIFTPRSPVRGPKSRQATRAASKKRTRGGEGATAKKQAKSSPRRASASAFDPPPVPKMPPPSARGSSTRRAAASEESAPEPSAAPGRTRKRRAPLKAAHREPVNEPLPFIEFIAEHPVGSTVSGEVVEFASHGAYVTVGDARCYIPLKSMGDPAPRSAREVLERGETREFVVAALDAPRRGIDLALPGVLSADDLAQKGEETTASAVDLQAPAVAGASLPESEATLAQRPARKATAKKATAKKATTRKKAAAKKAPAKRTTAAVKKTAAKKSTTRTTAAKKAPAKKTAARKATAKKAPAKKAAAKKATAKKAPAKKTAAKKTAARKAPATKATAKKATAKKATARKAPAKTASSRPAKRA